jgi:hypothetical protein
MAEFNLQGFQPFDIQKKRTDLSTPSQTILDSRERTRKSIDKHNMFTKGFGLLTGTTPGARVEYPTYGTSSKSQSAAIDKQINIDFMQAVDKIYKERGRLTEDELMTVGRAFNAGPAQYRLLKEMMPFIGIDRDEVAKQEVAASEARGAVVMDEVSTEHLRLIREASPDTVQNRVAEAISDINNSALSPARKNAIRKEYLAAASQAHALGKSARGEERTEREEVRAVNKELRAVNKADLELQKTAREASENKTEQLLIYNALKEMKEVNTTGTYMAEDGVITAMTPGMTMQREQEILADYAEKAFTAGVDIKKVQDGITAGIVNAPSTKQVIDLQAADPSQPYVFVSDSDIALANAGGVDRYVPVQDQNNLTDSFKISAIAAMSELGIDQVRGLQALQLMNKVGPLAAMQQRPELRDIISQIAVHVKKNQNILDKIFSGQFKQGAPSKPKVKVLQ